MMITLSPVGLSAINGRLGFSTTRNASWKQLWKTDISSCINAPAGLEVTGGAIGQVLSQRDMFGSKFAAHRPFFRPEPGVHLAMIPVLTGPFHDYRQQLWCTYALHIATFTSLAFAVDPLLLASCWWATADWDTQQRRYAFWAQFVFMFGFSKVVKLMGLFLRNPSDILFLPVSILFGYFHGLIKLYALFTLNMVCFEQPTSKLE